MDAKKPVKVLITGGCRSGKSEYALRLAEDHTKKVFIATAEAGDREMAERIERHKKRRGKDWRTVEEPVDLVEALVRSKNNAKVVVIDCLTLWLSNLLVKGDSIERIMDQVDALAQEIGDAEADFIIVTNEVGAGIVPGNELARRFRDLAGLTNQRLAQVCDRVVLMVAGIPLVIKGENHGTIK